MHRDNPYCGIDIILGLKLGDVIAFGKDGYHALQTSNHQFIRLKLKNRPSQLPEK
jgi:hypothetical protein